MGSGTFGGIFFGQYAMGGDSVSPLSIIEANGEYLPAVAVSGLFQRTVVVGEGAYRRAIMMNGEFTPVTAQGEFDPVVFVPDGSID